MYQLLFSKINAAAAASVLCYDYLSVYARSESIHVRDDAYQLVFVGQLGQSADRLFEGICIEGAEAFVYKHRIQLYAAGICLYFV